jgi:drug/metabolite transporter (DMT)-like permease
VSWLPLAVFALLVWSAQRVITKVALVRWSTARFYRWTAVCSILVYVPFAFFAPPDPSVLLGALGLSLLMALTFWLTTEATRLGPLSLVAPLTAMSPAITALLAVALLGERPDALAGAGIVCAVGAAVLLAFRRSSAVAARPWIHLALASLALQGLGAFLAKIVVTGSGPTTLLLTSVAVQLAVGLYIARAEPFALGDSLRGRGLAITAVLVGAALATVGYLGALSVGPASVIVPFVATSPALGGLAGIVLLRERATVGQVGGIALGIVAIVLLARSS